MKVEQQDLSQIIQDSFVPYALHVIKDRALSHSKDGLKPVARRILWTMHKMGLKSSGSFRKVSGIVGTTMADYHPHGDLAIADALVRMGQEWTFMVPLIDPQGNFGSSDGDPSAASRYIEARLSKAGEMLLEDTNDFIVPFEDNYDERTSEPLFLGGKFPNALINGNYGIAVSMSANIPSHNPIEIAEAVKLIAKKPKTSIKNLMEILPGPDFPTGGVIKDSGGIEDYLKTGRGSFELRAHGSIKKVNQRYQIVITQLPYQVTATSVIEKVVSLVKDKKIEGITSIQNYSDSDNGLQIVIDLKGGVEPKKMLDTLFQKTQMSTNYAVNINMINDKDEPRTIGFIELIRTYCDHRRDVVKKKTKLQIEHNNKRIELLGLYMKVAGKIDKVVELVKKSTDSTKLKSDMAKILNVTTQEAQIIIDMPLKSISKLERDKVQREHDALVKENERLEGILGSAVKINNIICKEMDEVVEMCGLKRKTKIVS